MLQPDPGRIGTIIDSSFAGDILAGADARKLRQSALFRSRHDELTALIHDTDHEELAA